MCGALLLLTAGASAMGACGGDATAPTRNVLADKWVKRANDSYRAADMDDVAHRELHRAVGGDEHVVVAVGGMPAEIALGSYQGRPIYAWLKTGNQYYDFERVFAGNQFERLDGNELLVDACLVYRLR